jgi:uncharacterized RDD family membrane protein YckC
MQEQEPNYYAAPKAAPLPETEAFELAGRGARFAAVMIDGIISSAILFPAMYLAGTWGRLTTLQISMLETMLWAVGGLVLYVLLHGRLLRLHGQTLGKRMVGIQAVSVVNGDVIPLQKMVVTRILPVHVLANLPPPLNYLTLIDALMIFRKDRRCLHDMLAGTRVVVTRKA